MKPLFGLSSHFVLDRVFGEKFGHFLSSLSAYDYIYDLKSLFSSQAVTQYEFDCLKQKKFFIVMCLYDSTGKIYVNQNVDENSSRTLPGCSVMSNEDLLDTVQRLSKNCCDSLFIEEIEPIAFVKNNFLCGKYSHDHLGIGFMARVKNISNSSLSQGQFIELSKEDSSKKFLYANKEIIQIFLNKFSNVITDFPETEVVVNNKYKARYLFHSCIMKKTLLHPIFTKKTQMRKMLLEKIIGSNSFLDISCGDSSFVYDVANLPDMQLVVGNDISWSQISVLNKSNQRVFFTNHNASYLPFIENSFDVVFCSNTLHHMNSRKELLLLFESLLKVAKKIIFVEIEDPSKTGFLHNILHKYWYVKFLKDVGNAYLTQSDFDILISDFFGDHAEVSFSSFNNLQGKYMIAEVTKNQSFLSKNKKNNYSCLSFSSLSLQSNLNISSFLKTI